MLAGAGTSNVQGQYIRAFANCANIDDSGTVKFVILLQEIVKMQIIHLLDFLMLI